MHCFMIYEVQTTHMHYQSVQTNKMDHCFVVFDNESFTQTVLCFPN